MRKVLIALAGLLASTSPAVAETMVIRAGAVLRDAASEPSGPATITVTDGKIVSIEPGSPPAPAGAREVDLSGKTVLPGLIDLHVHLTSDPGTDYRNEAVEPEEWGMMVGAKNALLTVKAGFTTVRDAGSAQYTGFALRSGTAEGLIPGPVECAEKVRKSSRAGADVIKITSTGGVLSQQGRGLEGHFTQAELDSIITTAHSLGVGTTDAKTSKGTLQNALHHASERTFNRITVDGDMSTNDTVLALANGAAGGASIKTGTTDHVLFLEALNEVCLKLAHMIVRDGEGVSKFVTVQVRGASSLQAARKVAEAIANSTLVKCAWAGNDPNWGRILDAAGYCGVRIREELVDIYYDGVIAVRGGTAAPTPKEKLVAAVTPDKFGVTVDLHQGKAFYTVYTTDLTEKYVELNLSE